MCCTMIQQVHSRTRQSISTQDLPSHVKNTLRKLFWPLWPNLNLAECFFKRLCKSSSRVFISVSVFLSTNFNALDSFNKDILLEASALIARSSAFSTIRDFESTTGSIFRSCINIQWMDIQWNLLDIYPIYWMDIQYYWNLSNLDILPVNDSTRISRGNCCLLNI